MDKNSKAAHGFPPRAVRAAALLVAFPRMYGKATGAPIIHDPDQYRRFAAAKRCSMAFDPKQLWQLSILETAGIATVITSALLIAGIAYAISEAVRFRLLARNVIWLKQRWAMLGSFVVMGHIHLRWSQTRHAGPRMTSNYSSKMWPLCKRLARMK
jgi:hypothetical protein